MARHESWAANIVWLDFTKYGKVSGGDLNDLCDLLNMILGRKPQRSVAVVLAPYLISEKTQHAGARGELRTVSAKIRKLFFITLSEKMLDHSLWYMCVCLLFVFKVPKLSS